MDQGRRNKLRNVVTQCRKLLEEAVGQALQGHFGIYAPADKGQRTKDQGPRTKDIVVEDDERMGHLAEEDRACRRDLIEHLNHIQALGYKPREALDQLVREIAFTHLNRLCAYKMMEARGLIREAVSRGVKSQGFFFYLADHPEDERLHRSGQQDEAYRHFLDWLGGTLSEEIGVLFNPNDPANRIYPPQRVLDEVLALINGDDLGGIWTEDETIGWVYQYFTPKELRDKARKESQAPRNSYELAFRNQFFTPRYVVEFLTDNTLGRIWYEMRKGETALKDRCRYLVRRPTEIFLEEGHSSLVTCHSEEGQPGSQMTNDQGQMTNDELLKQPVYIPHRDKKDPREIKILDPACGSGHFLLYCFDLLQIIYEEAYADPDLGPALKKDYPTLEELRRAVPGLILKHNLHGIDIDLRATQIAALALWLRAQRQLSLVLGPSRLDDPQWTRDNGQRTIRRMNIVCAEPMPGEADLLKEFTATLQPKVLGQLVEVVFEKMKLAGEAGSLLKIEEEISEAVAAAKKEYQAEMRRLKDEAGYLPGMAPPREATLFDFADMTDEAFLDRAEEAIVAALEQYATTAENGRGLRRRLFAEDTAHGFSFVDLCWQHFDVVLMNPPFGDPVSRTRGYLSATFPNARHDICAAEVERGLGLLTRKGMLGTITTRTALFIQTFANWRDAILSSFRLHTVADLGYGVLEAMVETAMYVIEKEDAARSGETSFASLLTTTEKELALIEYTRNSTTRLEWRKQNEFREIPGHPIAYWVPSGLIRRFSQMENFNAIGGEIRQGIATADDFRFLRLFWEVDPRQINPAAPTLDPEFSQHHWAPIAKGGEYSPWWDDIHLLLNWHNDGHEIKNFTDDDGKIRSRPQNLESFFRGGLTYPYRTTSAFGLRCLPRGCAFSVGGWGVFATNSFSHEDVLAVYNSRVARYYMEVLLGQGDSSVAGSAARNHGAEAVGGIPFPSRPFDRDTRQHISEMIGLWRQLYVDETSNDFCTPRMAACRASTLAESAKAAWRKRCQLLRRVAEVSQDVDRAVCNRRVAKLLKRARHRLLSPC